MKIFVKLPSVLMAMTVGLAVYSGTAHADWLEDTHDYKTINVSNTSATVSGTDTTNSRNASDTPAPATSTARLIWDGMTAPPNQAWSVTHYWHIVGSRSAALDTGYGFEGADTAIITVNGTAYQTKDSYNDPPASGYLHTSDAMPSYTSSSQSFYASQDPVSGDYYLTPSFSLSASAESHAWSGALPPIGGGTTWTNFAPGTASTNSVAANTTGIYYIP